MKIAPEELDAVIDAALRQANTPPAPHLPRSAASRSVGWAAAAVIAATAAYFAAGLVAILIAA
jgi:hypothetical protein